MATVDKSIGDNYIVMLDDKESLALQGIVNAFIGRAVDLPGLYPEEYVELARELSGKLVKSRMG